MAIRVEEIKVAQYPDGRLDTANAARFLGVSPKTLAIWRSAGTGPLFIKRGRIFYYMEDLRAWLDKHPRVQSSAQMQRRDSSISLASPVRRSRIQP
ncbi:MAG: helix-turn-helix domain-containing protein [Betaproteobacteria bacterium]